MDEGRTMTMWAVVYVEYGESVDGRGRVLGLYPSNSQAEAAMAAAARLYAQEFGLEYRDGPCFASVGDRDDIGCEYQIQRVCFAMPKVGDEEEAGRQVPNG